MNGAESFEIRRTLTCVMFAATAACAAACATLPSPSGWAPKPDDAGRDIRGAWVEARCEVGDSAFTMGGELIAVAGDSMLIEIPEGSLRSIPWSGLKRAQVVYFDSSPDAAGGLAAVGSLATVSNGAYLVLTFPVWIITGVAATNSRRDEAVVDVPSEALHPQDIAPYARFPQGLPPGFRMSRAAPPPTSADVPAAPEPVARASRKSGSGVVGAFGVFDNNGDTWQLAYHQQVYRQLFLLGGYSHLHNDLFDSEQVSVGARLGNPVFFGVKYIYTTNEVNEGSGVSMFGGLLMPVADRLSLGLMTGYDVTGLEFGQGEVFWGVLALELVVMKPR